MTAIGYIRQSRRADLDVALSRDSQLAAIQRMATADGVDVQIMEDMGKSGGRGKERLRPAYQQLLAAIEAGGVDAVYAISLTRLARSTSELIRVADLAQDHGVRLVFAKEGVMDPRTPIGQAQFGMMAVFSQFERALAIERAKDNVAIRRAKGQRMGRTPYGERPGDQPEAIQAAYRESGGSLNGTALLLNQRGIKSWAGVLWTGPALRLVIKRLMPGLIPNRASRGVKPSSPFLLYRLLRCPCGRTMTGSRPAGRRTVYRCHAAGTLPDHSRPWLVRESVLVPWVMAEAARLRVPSAVEVAVDDERRDVLAATRDRWGELFATGRIDVATFDAKVLPIDEEMARLRLSAQTSIEVPTIEWETDEPGEINTVLRSMWKWIELGPDLMPVLAEWFDRRLRAD